MAQLASKGGECSSVFCNPITHQALAVAGLSAGATIFGISSPGNGARREVGSSLDKYDGVGGSSDPNSRAYPTLTVRGRPVLPDPNVPVGKLALHNYQHSKLNEWGDFSPETEGAGSVMVGRTSFDYDIQLSGLREFVHRKRRSVGLVSDIKNI